MMSDSMREQVFEARRLVPWVLAGFGVAAVFGSSGATWMWWSGRGSDMVASVGRFGVALVLSVAAGVYLVRRAIAIRSAGELLRIDDVGLRGSTVGGGFWGRATEFSIPWQDVGRVMLRSDRFSEYLEVMDTDGELISLPVASIRPQRGLDGQALVDAIEAHRCHWTWNEPR